MPNPQYFASLQTSLIYPDLKEKIASKSEISHRTLQDDVQHIKTVAIYSIQSSSPTGKQITAVSLNTRQNYMYIYMYHEIWKSNMRMIQSSQENVYETEAVVYRDLWGLRGERGEGGGKCNY